MTKEEKMRLNEIIFCNLFKKLLIKNSNPIKVYDFMTATAEVIGANVLVLNSVLTIILNNDKQYMASKKEYIQLLKKSNMPVRQVVQTAHISFSTYYDKTQAPLHIVPKFDPIQYAEMMKVLKFFDETRTALEGGME
jgi:hypothetical protein